MALGGGNFITQNKVLPGTYINTVSLAKSTAELSERGTCALALALDWGESGKVFTVTAEDFQKNSLKLFGYNYADEKLKDIREIFKHAKTVHFYRLNDGEIAKNTYCNAKYGGIVGNNIQIVIENNEKNTTGLYDVSTYFKGVLVDKQTEIEGTTNNLVDNDYVTWIKNISLAVTNTPLTGGVTNTYDDSACQFFLDKIESYSFNTIGILDTNATALLVAWTKRMRDEVGAKFQAVIQGDTYTDVDYEGIVKIVNSNDTSLISWVVGALASCNINESLTNFKYDGENLIFTDYTQSELADLLTEGWFIFHKVGDDVRVLEDVNSFVSFTEEKSRDFSSNQTIRVIDQSAIDIALLFNTKYLGKIPNDESGRISLWNDILKLNQKMQDLRAIENFKADDLIIEKGETKKAVIVTNPIEPVNAMAQLYMTIIIK